MKTHFYINNKTFCGLKLSEPKATKKVNCKICVAIVEESKHTAPEKYYHNCEDLID